MSSLTLGPSESNRELHVEHNEDTEGEKALKSLLAKWLPIFHSHKIVDSFSIVALYEHYRAFRTELTETFFEYTEVPSLEDAQNHQVESLHDVDREKRGPVEPAMKSLHLYDEYLQKIFALFEGFLESQTELTFFSVESDFFDNDTPAHTDQIRITSRYRIDATSIPLDEACNNEHIFKDIVEILGLQNHNLQKALEKFQQLLMKRDVEQGRVQFIEDYTHRLAQALTSTPQLAAAKGFEIHMDENEKTPAESAEATIDTIRQYVLPNKYMANLMLGYDPNTKKMMTLEEKREFVKHVETWRSKSRETEEETEIETAGIVRPQSLHYESSEEESAIEKPDRVTKFMQYATENHVPSPEEQLEHDFEEILKDKRRIIFSEVAHHEDDKTLAQKEREIWTARVKEIIRHDAAKNGQYDRGRMWQLFLRFYNPRFAARTPDGRPLSKTPSYNSFRNTLDKEQYVKMEELSTYFAYDLYDEKKPERLEDDYKSDLGKKIGRTNSGLPIHPETAQLTNTMEQNFTKTYPTLKLYEWYSHVRAVSLDMQNHDCRNKEYAYLIDHEKMSEVDAVTKLIKENIMPNADIIALKNIVTKVVDLIDVEQLSNPGVLGLNQIYWGEQHVKRLAWYESTMQRYVSPDFSIEGDIFEELAYAMLYNDIHDVWVFGKQTFIDGTLVPGYRGLELFARQKGIDISILHRACNKVFKESERLNLDFMYLTVRDSFAEKCDIPLDRDKENIKKILQLEYNAIMKKQGKKESAVIEGIVQYTHAATKQENIDEIIAYAQKRNVELDISKIPTLEEDYVRKLTTPTRISPYDRELDRDDGGRHHHFDLDIEALQEILAKGGSEWNVSKVLEMNLRDFFSIPEERWFDADEYVTWSSDQPAARVIAHGNWTENMKTMNAIYLIYLDQKGVWTLVWDGTVADHGLLVKKYNLENEVIVGGGFGKVNKKLNLITLGSHMPMYYHEPRIVSATLLKNLFEKDIPGVKIVMAHDGLQDANRPYYDAEDKDPWYNEDKGEDRGI